MAEQNGNMEDHTGITAPQAGGTATGSTAGLLGKGKGKAVDPAPDVEMGDDDDEEEDDEDEGEDDEVSSGRAIFMGYFC